MKRLLVAVIAFGFFACHNFDDDKTAFCVDAGHICGTSGAGGGSAVEDSGTGGGAGGGTGGGVGGGGGGGVDGGSDAGTDAGTVTAAPWSYRFGGASCTQLVVSSVGATANGETAVAGTYAGNFCDIGTDGGQPGSAQTFFTTFSQSGDVELALAGAPVTRIASALATDEGTRWLVVERSGNPGPPVVDLNYSPVPNAPCLVGGSGDPGVTNQGICVVKVSPDGGATAISTWASASATVAAVATGPAGMWAMSGNTSGSLNSGGCTAWGNFGGFVLIGTDAGCVFAGNDCGVARAVAIDHGNGDVYSTYGQGSITQCNFWNYTTVNQRPGVTGSGIYLAHHTSSGALLWVREFSDWNVNGSAVAAANGVVYVAAPLSNTIYDQFFPDAGVSPIYPGTQDILVVRLFANNGAVMPGEYRVLGSNARDTLDSMQLDEDGGLWLVGGTNGGNGFVWSGGSFDARDGGVYVVRLDATSLATVDERLHHPAAAYTMARVNVTRDALVSGGNLRAPITVGTGGLLPGGTGQWGWAGTLQPR